MLRSWSWPGVHVVALEPAVGKGYGLGLFLPDQGSSLNPLRQAQVVARGVERLGPQDQLLGPHDADCARKTLRSSGARQLSEIEMSVGDLG